MFPGGEQVNHSGRDAEISTVSGGSMTECRDFVKINQCEVRTSNGVNGWFYVW